MGEEKEGKPLSKKMRESLALNSKTRKISSASQEDPEAAGRAAVKDAGGVGGGSRVERGAFLTGVVKPGVNADNEKLYCYCQCPHDEVSEMIGCDAPDCRLEWFHFECVGIMIPPDGKWYCPECTKRYGL